MVANNILSNQIQKDAEIHQTVELVPIIICSMVNRDAEYKYIIDGCLMVR